MILYSNEVTLKKCTEDEINFVQQAYCANQLGNIYKNQGLSEQALNYFYLAHEFDHNTLEYTYNLALSYLEINDFLKAMILFKQCLTQAFCANALGELYHYGKLGQININKAIEYYLIAYNFDNTNPTYIYNLARAYRFNLDLIKAKPFLIECTKINLSNIDKAICANTLGHIYQKENLYDQAINYYLIAYDLDRGHPLYTYDLAKAYEQVEAYRQAEPILQQCIRENFIHGFTKYNKAKCAHDLGSIYHSGILGEKDASKAIENYHIAYDLEPNNPVYIQKLAIIYYQVREYQISIPLLKECVNSSITYDFNDIARANCANWLGIYYAQENSEEMNVDTAIGYYLLANELDTNNPIYIYNLALTYCGAKKYQKAASLLEKCIKAPPFKEFTNIEKASCANKLGILYNKGELGVIDIDTILKNYHIAHDLNPNKTVYIYNLAITYYYAARYKDAVLYLKQCEEDISGTISNDLQIDCGAKLIGLEGEY